MGNHKLVHMAIILKKDKLHIKLSSRGHKFAKIQKTSADQKIQRNTLGHIWRNTAILPISVSPIAKLELLVISKCRKTTFVLTITRVLLIPNM